MNIKITVPRETAIKGGKFFNEICEACNRGSILKWNEDYTKASLEVDTKSFLTIDNIKDILTAGGEVENCPLTVVMPETDFNATIADKEIIKSLPNYQVEPMVVLEDIPEVDRDKISIATETDDTFKLNNLFKLTERDSYGNISFISSYNAEYIPASIVFKLFSNYEIA